MIRIKNITLWTLSILLCLLASDAVALIKILNVRHWVAPDHTRVVIDTSDEPDFVVEKGKDKILIDLRETSLPKTMPLQVVSDRPGIKSISLVRLVDEGVRVEITLADHVVDTNVFKLKKFEEKPDRVVVDIELPEVEQRETREREQVKTQIKDKIIVIDPGHGGEDPGAIGYGQTREKDVVLKIGKKLRDALNRKPGYRAFLTRSGDYYVSFHKRTKIAREYGADLFISIHADASRKRSVRGLSVYCLSTGGATSEAAKLLARKENLADIVGGSPNGESSDESDPIVLNMYQTNTINVSKTYATGILRNVKEVLPVKFATVQAAPFRVLKLPEIPSVLVETAFISNRTEEKLLRSGRYQTQIAEALAGAIGEFLPVAPSPKPEPAVRSAKQDIQADAGGGSNRADVDREKSLESGPAVQRPEPKTAKYRVKRGDTLEKIARRNGMTLSALLKLNGMSPEDPLYADRKIRVAVADRNAEANQAEPQDAGRTPVRAVKAGDAAPSRKSEPAVYRVKRGDSLDKIARRHDIPLGTLLKLNHMKLKDPLYVGRVVKLKPAESDGEGPSAAPPAGTAGPERYTYYRVKKGETLDQIARRNGTTIRNLRQLNRMKFSDPLLADRKLKVPQNPSL